MNSKLKLKMHSLNKVEKNIEAIGAMFPNCLTERKGESGEVEIAIDFDVLRQELSSVVVEGAAERYQFTWPEKRKSMLLANAPIAKTLRPCREESRDFDTTENLYIEGDNLDVLKLLQETYLGKVKMIYIDPPYNTGKDFVYNDEFRMHNSEFMDVSGMYDDEGNALFDIRQNNESNGRFHTDWLNMIYPRLKVARDLLTDDGVIFISINIKESHSMKKICDEIFGQKNLVGELVWESTTQPINSGAARFGLQNKTESIYLYARNKSAIEKFVLKEIEGELNYPHIGQFGKCRFEIIEKSDAGNYSRPTMKFQILGQYPREGKRWQIGEDTARELERLGKIEVVDGIVKKAIYPEDELDKQKFSPFWSFLSADKYNTAQNGKDELNTLMGCALGFDTVKPVELIKYLLSVIGDDYLTLDFFSGSATTAHAAMQLNAEDGGTRKFIMVQLPEETDEKSEARKAGYNNICEIGKERIRRAGAAIMQNVECRIKNEKNNSELSIMNSKLDLGFRVLKLDSTNMKDVYYNPQDYSTQLFAELESNIKEDRTPEDLLFQVMLDLGVLLSAKIEQSVIAGKKVFNVNDGYLIACFDSDVTEETVTAIAKLRPYYFAMRDSSMATDSVATNFEQIFETYSKDTIRKIL